MREDLDVRLENGSTCNIHLSPRCPISDRLDHW